MKLHDKIVLVTGGSRGIGKAISKLFVEEGAQVIITSKNIIKLEQTAKEINCSFFIYYIDLFISYSLICIKMQSVQYC